MSSDTVEIRSALGVMRAETSGDAHALLKRSPLSSSPVRSTGSRDPALFRTRAGFSYRRGPWGPKLADRADAAAGNGGGPFVAKTRIWVANSFRQKDFAPRLSARDPSARQFHRKRRSASTIINALAAAKIATNKLRQRKTAPEGSKRRERE
jgi:hypothetical protein